MGVYGWVGNIGQRYPPWWSWGPPPSQQLVNGGKTSWRFERPGVEPGVTTYKAVPQNRRGHARLTTLNHFQNHLSITSTHQREHLQ